MTDWLLPVELFERRESILTMWQRILARLLGKRTRIAFTGLPGSGKTVLFDFLTGNAYRPGYRPPLTSQSAEASRLPSKGRRIALTVVPGQPSNPRAEAIEEVLAANDAVDGIVHVACNGFVEPRSADAVADLVSKGFESIDQYCTVYRKAELDDIDETCELLRRSIRVGKKPTWMIVAVAKLDLYYDQAEQARSYYARTGSDFTKRLEQLVAQVGQDSFRWTATPVSTWLDNFHYNNETRRTQLTTPQRDHLIAKFLAELESYCAKH